MTRAEFSRAVRQGLGRAILYAREGRANEFGDLILDASLHCYSVDVQCEGTRASYMCELVDCLPDREYFRGQVLASLASSADDEHGFQRFRFATYLAMDGHSEAREAIYRAYSPRERFGEQMALGLVDMDGLEGLRFSAKKLGALIRGGCSALDVSWLWSYAKERCGEAAASNCLSEGAASCEDTAAFQAAILDARPKSATRPTTSELRGLDHRQLEASLPLLRPYQLEAWGSGASDEELRLAAHGLVGDASIEGRRQRLATFANRPYPLDPSLLFELAESTQDDLAYPALHALAQLENPNVREVAFALANEGSPRRGESPSLLTRNFQLDDRETVLKWLANERDPRVAHSMVFGIRRMWELHPDAASEIPMLKALFELSPCCMCREFAVDRMIQLDVLPAALRAECALDASDEIRALVAAG